MRTTNDDCLLCEKRKATQANSHIVPKFMGKSMLDDPKRRRGFEVSSTKSHLPPKFIQDTSKESYILCPECEAFFNLLETHVNNKAFANIRNRRSDELYVEVNGVLPYKSCLKVDPKIFHLFIYSIIWRCSITSVELFKRFKLEKSFEKEVRMSLMAYHSVTASELEKIINGSDIALTSSKYSILTYKSFLEPISGIILSLTNNTRPPYILLLNEYWLFLTDKDQMETKTDFTVSENIVPSSAKIKIGVLPEIVWSALHANVIDHAAKIAFNNAQKLGANPFLLDDDKI